ncbi:nucleotidyl transferase AbiEii/AbiGii toxin family protein [Aquiflexum sp.]|uniref:nucleotidyl transferase AbiEii/AbiGii toxin family protein n=1 Tax=Aquiflexum sp. TaxID=1872584 RepID=UPI003593940C
MFDDFRLVGGTALSLQLGHRMSLDIDLFSEKVYGSIDFDSIEKFLRSNFIYVSDPIQIPIGFGRSYMVGESSDSAIKLDLYYTDPFLEEEKTQDIIRFASMEEIGAMKIDVVQRGGRKKDFWDIHELLDRFTLGQLIKLHARKYPYTHDKKVILENLLDFSKADNEPDPKCLKGKYWELIKLDIVEAVENHILEFPND